jgi:hypothetical protein
MPGSVSRPVLRAHDLGQLWWLPSGGCGNGLGDTAWAEIAAVRADTVTPLLAAFRARGVAAYAQRSPRGWIRRCRRQSAEPPCRVWVGASSYGRAEQALLVILPRLAGSAPDAGI